MCRFCFPYQLQAKAEQGAYLQVVEDEREPIEERHLVFFEALLWGAGEAAADAYVLQRTEEAALATVGAREDALRTLYEALVEDAVSAFAAGSYGALKAFLPPLRKNEGALWLEEARAFITRYLPGWLRAVTTTVREMLAALIADGLADGLGIEQLRDYVLERWRDLSAYEAERIVRTEVVASSNYGSQAGARATGLPLEKEWLSAVDDRTRQTHRTASGQRVRLHETYTVGGHPAMFPGDPELPPGERIHCRCTEIYHVVGAAA